MCTHTRKIHIQYKTRLDVFQYCGVFLVWILPWHFFDILFTIFSLQGIPESWANLLQMSNISLSEQRNTLAILDMLLRLLSEKKVWTGVYDLDLDPWYRGHLIQNHEICYSKWRIALEKSILAKFYQNLAYLCQRWFSTDGTTFGATCKQFYRS